MGTHPIFESDFDCLTEWKRMSDFDDQFENAGSGASLTYPKQCSALRKNEFVMIKGKACKIVDMSTSKTGKHGHAKVHMVALDIFDGRKYEDICPSTHNMECPIVKRTEYQLIDIDDEGFCSLMDDTGETRDYVNEKYDKIKNSFKFINSLMTPSHSRDRKSALKSKTLLFFKGRILVLDFIDITMTVTGFSSLASSPISAQFGIDE